MGSLRSRSLIVAFFTLLSIYGIAPTIIYLNQPSDLRNDQEYMQKKIPKWLPKSYLNLGLDLQGGVQLVLGVNLEEAVENRLSRIGTELSHWSEEKKIPISTAYVVKGGNKLRVELSDAGRLEDLKEEIGKEFPTLRVAQRLDKGMDFEFKDDQIAAIKNSALEQAERVVRSRVDKWGVSEPIINRRADKSILVQLPGFKDPEKAKDLLGRTAQLKFKMVDDEFTGFAELAKNLPENIKADTNGSSVVFSSEDKNAILKLVEGKVPPDHEVLFSREELAGGKKYRYQSYVLHAATELTGDDVMEAQPTRDMQSLDNKPAVALKFTGAGGRRFAELTGKNVGKRMAIILDDVVESAPNINEKIPGGNARITLGGGRGYNQMFEEANQLSLVLKAGALPATITILEQRQVGASLGPELAQKGLMGVALGLALVFIFMVAYYHRPGLIACIALGLNGLYVTGVMTGFGFALTLPGIAGFVLSLGMAVDANVLINERIRQELRDGKPPRKALDIGFKKVFWTVFDSHVTTLLAAIILLETNTSGPIRGFAVTLIISLIISLYTSLYVSHLFFDAILGKTTSEKHVRKWLGGAAAFKPHNRFNINFLRYDFINTTAAIILCLTVAVVGVVKGFNWSVDFVGGTEVELAFKDNIEANEIRAVAAKAGIEDLTIQALKGSKRDYLLRFEEANHKAGEAKTETQVAVASGAKLIKLQEVVRTELAKFEPQVSRVDYVGPQVGRQLRNEGFTSMFWAVIGILIYLGFRFDFRFGSGAVLKLIPDACAMLGFYLFFWRSFDLTSIAALLTGIGYSVSDVIVVYDRIRENFQLHPKREMHENINISLNETLTRTINTSFVTNLSLVGIIVFGPDSIRNFAIAMSVGIVSATLTSNFVGSGYLLWIDKFWRKRKASSTVTPGSASVPREPVHNRP